MNTKHLFFVGLFTFFITLVITGLLVWQSDILRKMSGYELIGRFDTIGGLINGADVRYRGVSVGKVIRIKPKPTHIDIVFFIEKTIQVPVNSTVSILFDGLVGESYMQINLADDTTSFVKEHEVLRGNSASDLANFIDLGSQNLMQTDAILSELRTLLTDERLFLDIKSVIRNLAQVSDKMAAVSQQQEWQSIAVSGDQALRQLNTILARLSNTDAQLALTQFYTVMERLETFSELLSADKNVAAFETILAELADSSTDLNALLGSSGEGKGLMAQLLDVTFKTGAEVAYNAERKSGTFDTAFTLQSGRYGLLTGVGNYTGTTEVHHFQQLFLLTDRLQTRLGVFYKKEGIGLQYQLTPRLSVTGVYYDFEETAYLLKSSYRFYHDLRMDVGYRQDPLRTSGSLDVGLGLEF